MLIKKPIFMLFGKILLILSFIFVLTSNFVWAGTSALKQSLKDSYIVVIDPGHGGKDTGAIGKLDKKRLYKEKEYTLKIALEVAKQLRDPKFKTVLGKPVVTLLTRQKDNYVSLEARSLIAKENHAHLFVSLHMNSNANPQMRGLETYFLNNTDNESSSKLEEIENRMSKKFKKDQAKSLILRSVAADAIVEDSRLAASLIHKSITDTLNRENFGFENRGVKQAMLYVLLDAQAPSVLVEAFYLSNTKDLKLITRTETQVAIAEGITKGILRFLAQQ